MAVLTALSFAVAEDSRIFVVTNINQSNHQLSYERVRAIFLKQERFWPDGARAVPLERRKGSSARALFNSSILKMSDMELIDYWLEQKQRSGVVQPVQIDSDQTLLNVIEADPTTIGYLIGSSDESIQLLLKDRRLIAIPLIPQ